LSIRVRHERTGEPHAEYDPNASQLFITPLSCSLRGRSMTLQLRPGSQVAACYGSSTATEQYYCNFGVDPARLAQLQSGPLQITGSDAEGEVRVVELPGHPFFIGTLFVPQARSRAGAPHPLVSAFVRAALTRQSA
jgi:CTP synthase (UTP-ammonia lyase)